MANNPKSGFGFKRYIQGQGLLTFSSMLAIIFMISGCAPDQVRPTENKAYECDQEADRHIAAGDLERGIRMHEAFIKANPKNATAHYHLGYAMGQLGAREAEIFYYEKAASLGYKGGSDLYFNLGMAYTETGSYEKAEKAFLKSISLSPGKFPARLNLARLYIEIIKKPDKAEEQLVIVLALDPGNTEALELMAQITAPN